jgi:threonine dehydrogenase-like Zn-dependent dehydrogenase
VLLNCIWAFCGCSVGIFSAQCALVRGAARVVLIDSVQYRLDFAKKKLKDVLTINRKDKDVYKEVRSIFPQGPDVAIEAVGFHYVEVSIHLLAKPKSAMAV